MSQFTLELKIDGLLALPERVHERLDLVVRKTTLDIEAGAKRIVPVRTGNLKNSIGHEFPQPLQGRVNATANYAAYVEFGTRNSRAQPYLGPAVEAAREPFLRACAQAVQEAAGGE